jgi:hypothetical protein
MDSAGAAAWGLPPVTPPEERQASAGTADRRPETQALDTLCESPAYLWWTRERTLFLRKRDWYDQRRYEAPDRWILAMASRLHAQEGVPTYGDLFQVQALTPEQLAGLASLADTEGLAPALSRVHELLALLQAAGVDPTAPLPNLERLPAEERLRIWLPTAGMGPRQRPLVAACLETYPYPVASAQAAEFQARFFITSELQFARLPPEILKARGAWPPRYPDYRYTNVQVQFQLKSEGRLYGRSVYLPRSLPGDRRDRTKVEVVPEGRTD